MRDHDAQALNRFAVIKYMYVDNERTFVYSARRYDDIASSYICQHGLSKFH